MQTIKMVCIGFLMEYIVKILDEKQKDALKREGM